MGESMTDANFQRWVEVLTEECDHLIKRQDPRLGVEESSAKERAGATTRMVLYGIGRERPEVKRACRRLGIGVSYRCIQEFLL